MKKPIKESLKFVLQTYLRWILGHLFGVLSGSIFVGGSSILLLGQKMKPLDKILREPFAEEQIAINLYTLVLLAIYSTAVTWLSVKLYIWKTKPKHESYFFIEEGGVLWKTDTGQLNPNPFCPFHKYELIKIRDCFICPDCPKKTTISHDNVRFLKPIIQNKSEAKLAGHLVE